MEWNNVYLIALYNTILIPVVVIITGYLIGAVAGFLTSILATLFGNKAAFFIRNRLTFIGTIHHELAHALFAALTGAKVTKIELVKLKGNQLGSVQFYTRGNQVTKAIQLTISGIAPVVCGCISLSALYWTIHTYTFEVWQYVCLGFLGVCILFHMNMSDQDVKNVLRGLPYCMIILYAIFYFTKFSFLPII